MKLQALEKVKKVLTGIGVVVVLLPILIIVFFIFYELFGMCVNHLTTYNQTKRLQANLKKEISDIGILDVYSETDNTSGTGNHVECLSVITFLTEMQESDIVDSIADYYDNKKWEYYVVATDDDAYILYLIRSAPFAHNIEGH